MKTQIIALVAAGLVVNSVHAAPKAGKHRGENIGVGSGAVIGAIAGGPVGFLIGVATGGWLGNKMDRDRDTRIALEAEVEDAEARYARAAELTRSLEALLAENEDEIDQLRLVMHNQDGAYRDALAEAFEIEVYFRTGEAVLAANVAERVERLGAILAEFDGFSVVVEGHADPRGEVAFNEQLSADRAQAVREALIRAGLDSGVITTRAIGESDSKAGDGDLDAMALERRVDLSIVYPQPRENRVARQ